MVEFGLVVPILLMLLIAIADFSRVFSVGIALEAAARDAAEAAANEYLANPPPSRTPPCADAAPNLACPADSTDPAYYLALHDYAAGVVCDELRSLRETTFDSVTETCQGGAADTRPNMPVVVVCVHDGADTACASEANPGGEGIPAGCSDLVGGSTNYQSGTSKRWVEVQTCYHFKSILELPLFSLGNVWIQRTRTFTIPCWFVLIEDECGA